MEAPPAWANPQARTQMNSQQSAQQPSAAATTMTTTTTLDAQQHEQELFSKYSTLDEPVIETIMRDVRAVTQKLHLIIQPLDYSSQLLYYNSITPIYNYSIVSTSDTTSTASSTGATTTSSTTNNAAATTPSNTTETPTLSDHDRNIIKQLKDWDLWGPLLLCLLLGIILSLNAPTNQAALTFAAVFSSISIGSTIITINVQLLGGTISFFQSVCVLGYSVFPLMIAAFIIGCLKLIYISWLWIHFIIVVFGCLWALRISSIFISLYIRYERRALALYPVLFYYTFLAWLILLF